jgi:hypothetical protein
MNKITLIDLRTERSTTGIFFLPIYEQVYVFLLHDSLGPFLPLSVFLFFAILLSCNASQSCFHCKSCRDMLGIISGVAPFEPVHVDNITR